MVDSAVILPEKALLNPTHPRRFTRTSVPLAPPVGALPDFDSWELPQTRNSVMSSKSHRFSSMSGVSTISTSSGPTRKVRQKFEPVLPDELLTLLGERLTIVQSFDDGWCVVGRENSTFVQNAKSLFNKSQEPGGNIEIGVVPAWCFLKPVKGLRAERPIRCSSLGVTVNMEPSSRNDMISWSNF